MSAKFDPQNNYRTTLASAGYVPIKEAAQADYDRIGFMSGLEVHQQLLTEQKLFCRCPAGQFQKPEDYDAEIIRHMRPTLSELGEYDGTALMEFKTRKNIVYHISNRTACTYDVDDTPPFPLNRQALEIAIEIALLSRLKVVGEVHIARKQYLDGSIPTGFQRTAIIGVEGVIPLKHKKVRLIQLSLEEDSCREVSDIGHVRVYRTDRLGMPLIETVTYPDMKNPDEVKEACDYIRFLNRSAGKVRTGIGAARQDVNVSCRGGTRVELKGVSHTKWIPLLTHNECFRQWALLKIRDLLKNKVKQQKEWNIRSEPLKSIAGKLESSCFKELVNNGHKALAVNLQGFEGILSHFTQPKKCFADEISDRLKVVACIEKPNMTSSEAMEPMFPAKDWDQIRTLLKAAPDDAQMIFWGPEEDIKTALETIEERCRMAFTGVPNETRKTFEDGTTVFERVLPGADRMYPDTDSKPIPLEDAQIDEIRKSVPTEVADRYRQLKDWGVPEDCYTYIFVRNLYPVIEKIVTGLGQNPKTVGGVFGHLLKNIEGHYKKSPDFTYDRIYDLYKYVVGSKLDGEIIKTMLPVVYQYPKMDFDSVLVNLDFKRFSREEIASKIQFLRDKYKSIKTSKSPEAGKHWIMGQLRKPALGNIGLKELRNIADGCY
ncbi:Glu-tRNA(Gln) amidotransferase subunit GatE [candidate division TA06 bacterium]|uniref:Glu-tRNA(Gln) amidotransferase subunit GatE n=1 Tax=candidate division TA06 bacterium TaxID=2250710 RepID=A0A933MLG7_UNCT6|nr:Glu-tRNA(Gln) amidotransferase subunit GatE [candidate division TA06 bacterium]